MTEREVIVVGPSASHAASEPARRVADVIIAAQASDRLVQASRVAVALSVQPWEVDFRDGMRVPINGWWFVVRGVIRQAGEKGTLVLEATGERTPFKQKRRA